MFKLSVLRRCACPAAQIPPRGFNTLIFFHLFLVALSCHESNKEVQLEEEDSFIMIDGRRRESQAAVAQLSDAFNRRWLGFFSVRCGSCMCDFVPSAFHLFLV